MSNEINLFQVLCRPLEYLLFSLMKLKNRVHPYGPCFTNGPKFLEFSLFETLYIAIRHLVIVTL
jgi:hypothetical protein